MKYKEVYSGFPVLLFLLYYYFSVNTENNYPLRANGLTFSPKTQKHSNIHPVKYIFLKDGKKE